MYISLPEVEPAPPRITRLDSDRAGTEDRSSTSLFYTSRSVGQFLVTEDIPALSVVVKALCYKPEGRGFETRRGEAFVPSTGTR
jgi:hypothetical protein